MRVAAFRKTVWKYYQEHRRDFPWRNTRNPYRILVSEIMLQQTQAPRVEGFYQKFLDAFPNFEDLANAPLADVLKVWNGLGYNRRAVLMKRCAKEIVKDFAGQIPASRKDLEALPGIGPATAGAILAYAFQIPTPFIETNIRRVFIHTFFKKRRRVSDREVIELVEKTLDAKNPKEWYYALMDYGAFLGKTTVNPNRRSKSYHRQAPFRGSKRETRGKIVSLLVDTPAISLESLIRLTGKPRKEIWEIIAKMSRDGLIVSSRGFVRSAP